MPVVELYSKRQKRLRGEECPDVFVYDKIPEKFRIQVIYIIQDCFGIGIEKLLYQPIYDSLCREHGLLKLTICDIDFLPASESLKDLIRERSDTELVLDAIELCFKAINTICRKKGYQQHTHSKISPSDAIAELNLRFKENGLGYQFENNQIIRIDSTYLHSKAVKPTLKVLGNPAYRGAAEEFLKAHEEYRHSEYQNSLFWCLKALESTIKIICDRQNWSYNETDTARKLVKVCFDNELIPSYLQTQFSSFRSLLESGVPTIRNKKAGHGQGNKKIQVDEELASYALHLTASNILFLVKSEQKL